MLPTQYAKPVSRFHRQEANCYCHQEKRPEWQENQRLGIHFAYPRFDKRSESTPEAGISAMSTFWDVTPSFRTAAIRGGFGWRPSVRS
jgi:hypothetical protein